MSFQKLYANLVALVIDDMAVQLATLRGQLAMLGIAKIDQASSAEDALRLIRSKPYGLVLCDYNLNSKTDGQQLFEHLRDNALLPADCLFFMVTAENSYALVASATEHKPDAYLLKPITAGDIEERLKTLHERRAALGAIHTQLAKADLAAAIGECDKLLARKDRWFMHALQLKGETLLALGRHQDAKAIFVYALEQRSQLVWARLGLAMAHKAAKNYEEAKMIAYDLIGSPDGERNVAAYDVVVQALEAQGDADGALRVLRDSAVVIPSTRRQRLVGESAYRNGDLATATECFLKVSKATRGAVTAQPQDALALAQALADSGRVVECVNLLAESTPIYRNNPQFDSVASAIRAQALTKGGDAAGAAKAAQRARETMRHAKADFGTVALAKAELMAGNEQAGLKLLETAVRSDHDNPRVKQLIRRALADTGFGDRLEQIVEAATAGLTARVTAACTLFRNSCIDEALQVIEEAVREYPENSSVLLHAAQMNCMALRLKKELNASAVERVRLYLSRLDKLLPLNERVTQMQRYYRETVFSLRAQPA